MILLTLTGILATVAVLILLVMDWIPMPTRIYNYLDGIASGLCYLVPVLCVCGLLVIL